MALGGALTEGDAIRWWILPLLCIAIARPPNRDQEGNRPCQLLVWVTADGLIRAAQVDAWVVLPIIWEAKGNMATRPPKRPDRPDLPIAVLATNQQLQIRPPDYSSGALTRGEQEDCVVHVDINFSGHVEQLKITESTGSAEVDEALADAIYLARFIPAQRDQKLVRASTDIALHWQLPDAPSAAPR